MHTQPGLGRSHDAAHGIDLAPMLDFVINLLIGIYDITFSTTE